MCVGDVVEDSMGVVHGGRASNTPLREGLPRAPEDCLLRSLERGRPFPTP